MANNPPLGWGDMDEFAERVEDLEVAFGMPLLVTVPLGWGDMDEFEARVRVLEDLAGEVQGGAGSGYGIGAFGLVPWDTTTVPSGASEGLSHGVLVPHLATIGWGRTINQTFFSPLNDLMDRVTALEEAIEE